MFDGEAVVAAVKAAEAAGCQVVTVAMLGHKCDVAVMAMHEDLRELRPLQTALQHAGLEVVDSLRQPHRGQRVRHGDAGGDDEAAALPDDPAEPRRLRDAGMVLLPDEQEARGATPTGSRCRTSVAAS